MVVTGGSRIPEREGTPGQGNEHGDEFSKCLLNGRLKGRKNLERGSLLKARTTFINPPSIFGGPAQSEALCLLLEPQR